MRSKKQVNQSSNLVGVNKDVIVSMLKVSQSIQVCINYVLNYMSDESEGKSFALKFVGQNSKHG